MQAAHPIISITAVLSWEEVKKTECFAIIFAIVKPRPRCRWRVKDLALQKLRTMVTFTELMTKGLRQGDRQRETTLQKRRIN